MCTKFQRYSKQERRAAPWLRLYPNPPAVTIHNSLADRQANPSTGIFFSMKALENSKHLFQILRLDAYAIVLHRKDPFFSVFTARHMNERGCITTVLHGVAN